jgi:hypothetical protein
MNRNKQVNILALLILAGLTTALTVHALTMQELIQGYDNPKGQVLGAGTPTFIQGAGNNVGAVASISKAFTTNVGAHHLIVVNCSWADFGNYITATVTDTLGLTYATAVGPKRDAGNNYTIQVFYVKDSGNGGPDAPQCNFSGTDSGTTAINILEYSGTDLASPLDVISSGTATTGVALDSGSVTTNFPNELIVGYTFSQTAASVGAGFSADINNDGFISESKVVASTGSYNTTATQSSSGFWTITMAAFKADTSGGSGSDTVAPSTPTSLSASAISSSAINLSWIASTDNVGVTGYKIFRNGSQIGTSGSTSYNDIGLSPSTVYSYTVSAYDATGNDSSQSTSASAITKTSPPPAPGNIYIAQTVAGSANGSSCANAYAISFFNTASNWGTDAGKIGPGITVHLCGIITSLMTFQGSGSSGSPVTVLFESGAKMSAPTWGGNNSAIFASGTHTYLVVDGGTNGIIEATDNGSSPIYGYQDDISAVDLQICNNCIIRNLMVRNMFVKTSNDSQGAGGGIFIKGSNSKIYNNTIYECMMGIGYNYMAGSTTLNGEIYGNTIYNMNHAIAVGDTGSGAIFSGLLIHDNVIHDAAKWDDLINNNFHHNGIIVFITNNDSVVSGLKIYNNYIYGDFGKRETGHIFLDGEGNGSAGGFNGALIFNNLLVDNSSENGPSNGLITLKLNGSSPAVGVYNNVMYFTTEVGSRDVRNTGSSGAVLTLKNNVTVHGYGVYNDSNNTIISDYNNWYALSGTDVTDGSHSKTTNPNLDASFKPQSSSVVLIGIGINMTSLGIAALNFDKAGVARPASGAWDIGAYQYTGGGTPLTTVPGDLNLDHVVNALDYSILNSHWLQNYPTADINTDGLVNSLDFAILKSNWGKTW